MELQQKSPKGFQEISQMMKNNIDPRNILQQYFGQATPEQKENIFKIAKQWGCPDSILAQIQNKR